MDGMFPVNLRKFVAPEFLFGDGALNRAGQYARNYGGIRVLVVSDAGVIAAGWTGKVLEILERSSMPHVLFSGLSSNPKDTEVMAGASFYLKEKCNIIVAVGGGSPIDCAKGIGVVVSNGGHILDYEGIDCITLPCPPIICIPTTAGSAADVSQFAIITDTREKRKIAIVSKALVPEVSLIDPGVTATLSPDLTAEQGYDTLVHAIESYVSNASSPITDLLALEALRLVHSNLVTAVKEPHNMKARYHLMLATLEAGLAFSNAGLGAVHALAHSLGGFTDAVHGETNARLLPRVIGFNYGAAPERYRRIAETIGLNLSGIGEREIKESLTGALDAFREEVGISGDFKGIELSHGDIETITANALRDPCLATNPRPVEKEDIEALYESAIPIRC